MKSIKLILITIIGLFLTANVFGQALLNPAVVGEKQTVSPGAAFTYFVELHKTKNLTQIPTTDEGQNNYYIWKIYESDATATRGALKKEYNTDFANAVGKNDQEVSWSADITDFAQGKYYLVVVTEHPNHGGEGVNDVNSEDVDKDLCVASESEFFVYVGDNFNIEITDAPKYYCYNDIDNTGGDATAKGYDDIKLRFNGKAPWTITFNVVAKDGTATITGKSVVVDDKQVTPDVDGYFTYSMPLSRIDAGEISGDAADKDLYYTFEIVEVTDANSLNGLTGSAELSRNLKKTYGVYTNPKVTKINFK